MTIQTAPQLADLCLTLLGSDRGLSDSEAAVVRKAEPSQLTARQVAEIRRAIKRGQDPLGTAFSSIRSAEVRRELGAVYTPYSIVRSMIGWLRRQGPLKRVVDPGAGSGRFILSAATAFPRADLVAVEMDPLAALMLRASTRVRGYSNRLDVIVADYRDVVLPSVSGRTGFVGNPPYVRHHDIEDRWKQWYSERLARLGIRASTLAGLHLHFYLKTHLLARIGDVGAFVTSSEWLDVNYGEALRRLLIEELGGIALHVLEPTVQAFPGTATTAAIACFRMGERTSPVQVRSVKRLAKLNTLSHGKKVARDRFTGARWSSIIRPSPHDVVGAIELGELFRVHRGQVTGANDVWIESAYSRTLPERLRKATVTKARDLLEAGARLASTDNLRRVVDLPPDLDELDRDERQSVEVFLEWARKQGADQSYIAQHRRAWWSVGLKDPAPILCTYMARRAPQFTLNTCGARHINIAHGLYPRAPVSSESLVRLVEWLNENVGQHSGRTYAGGLTKFEPKEIERLRIPTLESFA